MENEKTREKLDVERVAIKLYQTERRRNGFPVEHWADITETGREFWQGWATMLLETVDVYAKQSDTGPAPDVEEAPKVIGTVEIEPSEEMRAAIAAASGLPSNVFPPPPTSPEPPASGYHHARAAAHRAAARRRQGEFREQFRAMWEDAIEESANEAKQPRLINHDLDGFELALSQMLERLEGWLKTMKAGDVLPEIPPNPLKLHEVKALAHGTESLLMEVRVLQRLCHTTSMQRAVGDVLTLDVENFPAFLRMECCHVAKKILEAFTVLPKHAGSPAQPTGDLFGKN